MTSAAILLIGRRTTRSKAPLERHATRLARRGLVDDVHTAVYESEPVRELRDQLAAITADRVYAVPMQAAHTFETLEDVPAALSHVPGEVHYCEPVGRSPAVTDVLASKAAALEPPAADVSLVLVGFGSSSKPYHRQTTEYHASRLEAESDYGEVLSCYLLQNPTVECVRYNVSNDRAVAVPLFLPRTAATEEQIPEKLEVDRGGIEYADPLGAHERVTDAVHAEVVKQRTLAARGGAEMASFEARLTANRRPVVTDGEGVRREDVSREDVPR
jgi:sirohydrochlorin ferrochelatase